MSGMRWSIVASVLLLGALAFWLIRESAGPPGTVEPNSRDVDATEVVRSDSEAAARPLSGGRAGDSIPGRANPVREASEDEPSIDTPAVDPRSPSERYTDALAELARLFEKPGELTREEAAELIAARRAAKDELTAAVEQLGPGGAAWVRETWFQAERDLSLREKLLLVDGLGLLDDRDVVPLLRELLAGDPNLLVRKSAIAALGQRDEAGVVDVLTDLLAGPQSRGLEVPTVQALSGREAGLRPLSEFLRSGREATAALEAIGAIARIGNEEAAATLVGVARDQALALPLRAGAIHALRRSFPEDTREVLEELTRDASASVQRTAALALEALDVEAARDEAKAAPAGAGEADGDSMSEAQGANAADGS